SGVALAEVEKILDRLRAEDASFRADARQLFERVPYVTPNGHAIIDMLLWSGGLQPADSHRRAEARRSTAARSTGAMTFWTDAAILGAAGIPSVVFGPGGAGLHGVEEFAWIDQVLECKAALVDAAERFCR